MADLEPWRARGVLLVGATGGIGRALAAEEPGGLTGQVLGVDGGLAGARPR